MGIPATTIADRLAADIDDGRLTAGARLPTHRELAHRHGVALNTASRGMRLLAERGLVVGEVGRGSYVRALGHVDAASFRIEAQPPGMIDLGSNTMPLPGLADRFEAAARLVLRRDRAAMAGYQPHAGRAADRAAGATWLSRRGHLPNDPSRVVVCAGAQHAVMVALMATARRGDTVAVEALTWPGIRASADALGVELLPVPMDAHGLRPRALLRLAARHRIAALYCTPTVQNPTATTMPLARRQAVAAIARRLDFAIIEDDAYGFLAEDGPDGAPAEPPPLASIAPERTWHVRSTSKCFTPGLRTAWLMVPPGQEARAATLVRATVWTAPPLGAAIASLWVGDGTAALLESGKRAEALHRRQRAAAMLPMATPAGQHSASMHLWVSLPPGLRAQDATVLAAQAGVVVTPAAAFTVKAAPNAVRLCLGAPGTVEEMGRALAILRQVWR